MSLTNYPGQVAGVKRQSPASISTHTYSHIFMHTNVDTEAHLTTDLQK